MNKQIKEGLKQGAAELGKAVTKPAIKTIGDAMARSKKPFWRKLVAFFRGTK